MTIRPNNLRLCFLISKLNFAEINVSHTKYILRILQGSFKIVSVTFIKEMKEM
jgi:hypothetical protein